MNDYNDIVIKPADTFQDVLDSFLPIQKIVFLKALQYVDKNQDYSSLDKVSLKVEDGVELTIEEALDSLDPMQFIFVNDALKAINNLKKNKVVKHYGILGMKWGVRKEYERRGREYAKGNVMFGDWKRTKSEQDVIRQCKGIKFTSAADDIEITSNITTVLRNNKIDLTQPTYFSVVEADKKFWKDTFLPQTQKLDINEMSLKRPLKIAGVETMVKTYADVLKETPEWTGILSSKSQKEVKFYKDTGMVPDNLRTNIYNWVRDDAIAERHGVNNYGWQKVKEKLSANKYDGILDVNAIGGQVSYAGYLPMILTKSDAIGKIKVTSIVNKGRKQFDDGAQKIIKEVMADQYKALVDKFGKKEADKRVLDKIDKDVKNARLFLNSDMSKQLIDAYLNEYRKVATNMVNKR